MHAAHMGVHVRRYLCPFATIRTLEFRLLATLETHVLLHITKILVSVTALGTLIPPLSVIPLLLHRIIGIPVGAVSVTGLTRELNIGIPEAVVTLRRGRSVKDEMLLQRHRVRIVGQLLLLLILSNS